jgi:hypothetical protein
MAAAAALLAAPLSAAPPAGAEEAIARQQSALRSSLGLDCDRGRGGEEIVVCGRQGPDPNRLPLPVEPEPGARIAGEPVVPTEALALTAKKCTTVGPNQQCSGGLPILPIALWLARTAIDAIKNEG